MVISGRSVILITLFSDRLRPILLPVTDNCPFFNQWNGENDRRMCVYSNSRNDVPRVAQRYGTIAAHTRRRASVLVVFVVFCVYMYKFVGLIRRTPPPTFSDTAITDRHSDTTNFQLRAHWVRISWSIKSEKSFGHVPPVGVEPSTSCMQGTLSTRPGSPLNDRRKDFMIYLYESMCRTGCQTRYRQCCAARQGTTNPLFQKG